MGHKTDWNTTDSNRHNYSPSVPSDSTSDTGGLLESVPTISHSGSGTEVEVLLRDLGVLRPGE